MTETKPHWIQFELGANPPFSSAVQLDMNLIQRVQLIRGNNQVKGVRLRYDNEVLILKDESARSFLKHWEPFKTMLHTDPPAMVPITGILLPDEWLDQALDAYRLNPKIR